MEKMLTWGLRRKKDQETGETMEGQKGAEVFLGRKSSNEGRAGVSSAAERARKRETRGRP